MKRLALLCLVLTVAGCGGGGGTRTVSVRPTLPRALAQDLRARTDAVTAALAAGDGCTARARAVALQGEVIDAVSAGRVPPRFEEPLQSAVNELAGAISCTPPPAPEPKPHDHPHHPKPPHDHGKHGKK